MTPEEITTPLEAQGEASGFDARTHLITDWADARTTVQQNCVEMVCEDDQGVHTFTFWIDPRTVEYA